VSKAAVSRLVGAGDTLAAERSYVRRVLPRAVARGLVPGELPTAATVLCGLAFTASGYLRGRSEAGSIRARSFSSSDWSRSSSSSR
jgi:hypothetical protein